MRQKPTHISYLSFGKVKKEKRGGEEEEEDERRREKERKIEKEQHTNYGPRWEPGIECRNMGRGI